MKERLIKGLDERLNQRHDHVLFMHAFMGNHEVEYKVRYGVGVNVSSPVHNACQRVSILIRECYLP